MSDRARRARWRLILGADAGEALGVELTGIEASQDQALDFLYHREAGRGRNVRRGGAAGGRAGGSGPSQLTVPEWIALVHELFPKRTIERLERDALERYRIDEIVTNPDVLGRVKPSVPLLRAVLHTKHLMNREVLGIARQLVRRVVEDLMERIARPVQSRFTGAVLRRRSSLRIARNFDAGTTLRRNLGRWDPVARRLVIDRPSFLSRVRRQSDRWQVIVLVDESGSMADSVIHAAVTASVFWGIRALRTHLVLFDTEVVDVTDVCTDPVETLMKVQLGGGTDIGRALAYAAGLVDDPRRTIVVLITDFYEGAPPGRLLGTAAALLGSGVTLLGLAALSSEAEPAYDRDIASQLVALGAHVGAMTPGELASWVAEKVR